MVWRQRRWVSVCSSLRARGKRSALSKSRPKKVPKSADPETKLPLSEAVRAMEFRWTDEYSQKASQGDQKSIVMMAHLHCVGYGSARQSASKAISWLLKADPAYMPANHMLRRIVPESEVNAILEFKALVHQSQYDEACRLVASRPKHEFLRTAEVLQEIASMPRHASGESRLLRHLRSMLRAPLLEHPKLNAQETFVWNKIMRETEASASDDLSQGRRRSDVGVQKRRRKRREDAEREN
mmetsp:Transcript_6086/g.11445  ORF Transcript_6086/g.11445 Transcript_6086/m.11445 type:complete len:240 (-) Transcript_6086:68-787(-)